MKLSTISYLYARRLRTHPVQELLAALGIALGVALVFAVQVATSSVSDGSAQIVHGIVGRADLELHGVGEVGVAEALARRASALPGVVRVVRGVDATATATGPSGRRVTLQLASADLAPGSGGGLARDPLVNMGPRALVLPQATAEQLGVSETFSPGTPVALPTVTVQARGQLFPMKVSAVLGRDTAGALASALAAFSSVRTLQLMLDMPRRLTGVLVESSAGAHETVKRELERIAPIGAAVSDPNSEIHLLSQATAPNRQATGFFALVAGLVGLLLAFNAMLLSVPERRRLVADLRIQGARQLDIAALLIFQACCLGLVASLAGVALGDVLCRALFRETPGYLAAAFPLGTQTVIGWSAALISIAAGLGAACLASLPPLLDLRRSKAVDAVRFAAGEPGQGVTMRVRAVLFGVAIVLMLASFLLPRLLGARIQVASIVLLALATLFAVPLAFAAAVAAAQLLAARSDRLNVLLLATRTLRATTVRSLALAATGAIAVFGTVAAEGAHRDLLDGLYGDYAGYVASADLWVTNPGDYLSTRGLPAARIVPMVERVKGVRLVRRYYGGFLDVAGHRAWVIARAPQALQTFPATQIVSGDPRLASGRLRAGGWLTLSAQLAETLKVKPGEEVALPTPVGVRSLRLAATTTNLGWSAGAIVLSTGDYVQDWAGSQPTALEVRLAAGVSVASVQRAIRSQIGAGSGLAIETPAERSAQANPLAREGLARLSDISLLLSFAAALATAAAMAASIWQRRPSLASLRLQSFNRRQLRTIILLEAGIVIVSGCATGAVAGVWAHAQIDRYLRLVSGFPAPFTPAISELLVQVAVIFAATLLALAAPGVIASDAPPRLALGERD